MSDAAESHRRVAGAFTSRVEAIAGDAWDNPAPVEGWKTRDVVRHLTEWFPAFLKSCSGIELPIGPSPDDDPAGAWRVHSEAVQALLDDPANADKVYSSEFLGEVPLGDAIDRFYTADVFLHTWDLARAAGLDESLDPDKCAELLEGMLPHDELLRSSGHYGPRIDVPADADVQTQLLAFIGRRP